MGAKVNLTYRGQDKLIGTVDDVTVLMYLTSISLKWYKNNTDNQIEIIKSIPDNVIEVFQISNAISIREGSTWTQLVNYGRLLGMTDEQSVFFANQNVGISRETMIDQLDTLQADIIAQKKQQIQDAEDAIKEQVTNEEFKELELEPIFNQPDPTIVNTDLEKLPDTKGDIAEQVFDFQISEDLPLVIENPITQKPKTIEMPKEEIVKKESTEKEKLFTPEEKSFFEKNVNLILTGVILTGVSLTGYAVISHYRKK